MTGKRLKFGHLERDRESKVRVDEMTERSEISLFRVLFVCNYTRSPLYIRQI